jgi:hypothetical protein
MFTITSICHPAAASFKLPYSALYQYLGRFQTILIRSYFCGIAA